MKSDLSVGCRVGRGGFFGVAALLFAGLFVVPHGSFAVEEGPQLREMPQENVQLLDLPLGNPDGFRLALRKDGRDLRLDLRRFSLRTEEFRVQSYRRDGSFEDVSVPEPRTYRGSIDGDPSGVVLASFTSRGLVARVVSPLAETWIVEPVPSGGNTAPLYRIVEEDHDHFGGRECGCDGVGRVISSGAEGEGDEESNRERSRLGASCLKECEIAFDADFEYYQAQGSSVANVVATIESHMNAVNFFYARDLKVTHLITQIVVREAPFYTPTGGGNLLDLFRGEWTSTLAAVPRDIAHLMTGKPGSLIEFGGLAYVGVVCDFNFGYGWSMDSANIIGHEVGHNWGSGHCHDVTPCNAMCGACFLIAPNTKEIMEAHRDSRSCLDDVGPYPTPVPPYAHPEGIVLRRDELEALSSLAFDVLGNDQDGNCDALSLDGFDVLSEKGAAISLSSGTGPGGRDELLYAPPAVPFVGTDRFSYTVGDGNGGVGIGTVTVEVRPLELSGWWRLDESSGTEAPDSSPEKKDGQLLGDPTWVDGVFRGALAFDGDDAVSLPALNLDTDRLTLACWLKRNGNQGAFAGILFSRDGSTKAGLTFGTANELRYNWDGAGIAWNSGLVVPNDQWVFVALVVEPDQATLYLHDGALQFATRVASHAVEEFDGEFRLGLDPTGVPRYFTGSLDEARIYDYALSQQDVEELVDLGGPAVFAQPADGGELVEKGGDLRWVSGLQAQTRRVYFGTDFATVRDAIPGSPVDQGLRSGPRFSPGSLVEGTSYFWRVDESVGGAVVRGETRQFQPVVSSRWRLDEAGGAVAIDSCRSLDGTYLGGVPNESAPTFLLGSAVRFDGIDDSIQVPALDLNSDRVTITAWIRRDGGQSFTGIVFSRDGNTVAGLNVGDNHRLGYHWNNDSATWSWDSGLFIPNDEWIFVALVVEPDQATVYKAFPQGALVSSVNSVSHGVEEFDGALHIGRDTSGARFFRGWIDDVRIFNAALSFSDVEEILLDSTCSASGTVDLGSGDVADVLRLNEQPELLEIATGEPIEIRLDPSPSGPSPADYVLLVWSGEGGSPVALDVSGSTLGCFVQPTPLHPGLSPQPFRCLRSPGFPPAVCRGVQEKTGPPQAPWTLTLNNGLSSPTVVTLQVLLQDSGAGNPFGFSVGNAVTLRVVD